jgi:hypothetical protein
VDAALDQAASGEDAGEDACPPPATFCDDFEQAPLEAAWLVDESGGGTIAIDSVRPRNKGESLHAHTVGATSYAFAYRSVRATGASTDVRVWAYYQGVPAADLQEIYSGPEVGDAASSACPEVDLMAASAEFAVGENQSCAEMPMPSVVSSVKIPVGEWVCLEWAITAGSNEVDLWVNGAPVWETTLAVPAGCTFDAYALGLNGNGTGAGDAFFDDLAIGPSRLGCE